MDPQNTHEKNFFDSRNIHEKNFGPMKNPRRHGGMMALDPPDPQWHVTHEI